MKASELRKMNIEGLKARRIELSKDISLLRFQNVTGQLENPLKIRFLRRDIGRVETIINELRSKEE